MSLNQLDMGSWPVAILAGGVARRLRPITAAIPKALVQVAGKPFLLHQLRILRNAGIRKVVLCVGYRGEMIEQEFGNGSAIGMELKYSFDGPELLGTGGALKKALPLLGQRFLILYGDSYLPIDYGEAAAAFVASGKSGLMTVFRNDGRWDRSNVWFENGVIRGYDKKRLTPRMKYIDYGLGVLQAEALLRWPNDGAFDLAEVYADLIADNQMAGLEVDSRFFEVGSPEGLAELDAMLTSRQLSSSP
jgi:NDP-sugar pyrophosphorylase family protein